jgi:hypothetical protein
VKPLALLPVTGKKTKSVMCLLIVWIVAVICVQLTLFQKTKCLADCSTLLIKRTGCQSQVLVGKGSEFFRSHLYDFTGLQKNRKYLLSS